jgi:hypothetical protein
MLLVRVFPGQPDQAIVFLQQARTILKSQRQHPEMLIRVEQMLQEL